VAARLGDPVNHFFTINEFRSFAEGTYQGFDVDPEALYSAPRHVQSLCGATSVCITENGCGASDAVAGEGQVYDSDRVMFLRACLGQLQRATSEGVPVHGCLLWSAEDNLEWMDGFGNRFGLTCVDFQTRQRLPKQSAEWFREAARQNAVVSDGLSPPAQGAGARCGSGPSAGTRPVATRCGRRASPAAGAPRQRAATMADRRGRSPAAAPPAEAAHPAAGRGRSRRGPVARGRRAAVRRNVPREARREVTPVCR
jgi:hypothetical protein